MSAYFEFEGQIVPMEWGKSTYTVLPLPGDIANALSELGAKRVAGEIGEYPVNLALNKAPVIDGVFLWTGKSLIDAAGFEPGQALEVRLRPAPADFVDVPNDVTNAIAKNAATAGWSSLSPGKQRAAIHHINTAKRAETRAKRIEHLCQDLTS